MKPKGLECICEKENESICHFFGKSIFKVDVSGAIQDKFALEPDMGKDVPLSTPNAKFFFVVRLLIER